MTTPRTKSLLMRPGLTPIVALAIAVFSTGPAHAQGPDPAPAGDAADTTTLLPMEADVGIRTVGLQRIPLGADVLRESQPDLRDVRIFDAAGAEVPWLLAGTIPAPPTRTAEPVVPTEATQEQRQTEHGEATFHEGFVIELPPVPADATGWDLSIATDQQEFTRSYTVSERRTGGADSERGRGTIFRFLGPLRQKLDVPLSLGEGTYLVTFDGEGEDYLTPSFSAVASRPRAATSTVEVPLTVESIDHTDGVSVLTFRRPRGLVPSKLIFDTATAAFHRRFEVRDLGPGSEARSLGDGTVYRIPEIGGAGDLEVRLGHARGDLLEVRVSNGDAPALDQLTVTAVIEQPILVAHLEADATLRFGGGRLLPPRYDLQQLAHTALGRRLGFRDLPEAQLSASRPNPGYDHRPALAWAMQPGAAVEAFRYHMTRSLYFDAELEGLSRVRLRAEDLAVLEADLRDLRVADDAGNQWPYLVEEAAAEEDVARYPDREGHEDGSQYTTVLARRAIPFTGITVRTSAAFVDRDFVLYVRAGEQPERELTRGRLSRAPGSDEELRVAVAGRGQELRLVVLDGADAPLPGVEIVAHVPVPDLYVAAPRGAYRLLLGDPEATTPTYEVRRARALMLSVASAEVSPGPLLDNPEYLPPRRSLHLEDWLLWAVLILAILILVALTLRATRNEKPRNEPAEHAGREVPEAAPDPDPPGEPAPEPPDEPAAT